MRSAGLNRHCENRLGDEMRLTRRDFGRLAAGTAVAAAGTSARATGMIGVDYLEGLSLPSALPDDARYLPPSAVHAAYSHAVYVNTATSGEGMQKMWVLGRAGDGWSLAMAEQEHAAAGYSWPVSTGIHYAGDNRSGPTPTGIFNLDERSGRHRTGWGSPGMYKAIYIDLHYNGGRISGVALHGTTENKYRRLGRADSHGCVRMTQGNMDQFWGLFHPGGARDEDSPMWGEVPRYFASAPENSLDSRSGYVRDGSLLYGEDGALLTRAGYRALLVFFRDDL